MLFDTLLDDAAMFPPSRLPPAGAVTAHAAHRAAWYAGLVGPLLCPPDALPAVPAGTPVGLVVRGDLGAALAAVTPDVVAVEVATDDVAAAATALDRTDLTGYLETPRGDLAILGDVAASGHRAKLRTGGLEAAAFPREDEVAGFVTGCVARSLPFKCTAGLHHAVRHTDPATGFEHHGFLNVLLATAAALDGAGIEAAAALLGLRSGPDVAARVAALPPDVAAAVRRSFVSFGTCSVTEPVDDLVALGLVTAP